MLDSVNTLVKVLLFLFDFAGEGIGKWESTIETFPLFAASHGDEGDVVLIPRRGEGEYWYRRGGIIPGTVPLSFTC